MTSDRLRDLWPSLRTMDMLQIVHDDKDDPGWMTELAPWERDELRDACEDELAMLQREAERRSADGHPELGDDWRIDDEPTEDGGFRPGVVPDESASESDE